MRAMRAIKVDNATTWQLTLVWLGLALLLAGLIVGVFPMLPMTTATGAPMMGVPHWAVWQWGGLAGAGVVLMVWGRLRASS